MALLKAKLVLIRPSGSSKWRWIGPLINKLCCQNTMQKCLMSKGRVTSKTHTTSFDEKLLQHLVCPLSKKQLRFDKARNELVCDELGIAYPVINGIPNLVPQDARTIKDESKSPKTT